MNRDFFTAVVIAGLALTGCSHPADPAARVELAEGVDPAEDCFPSEEAIAATTSTDEDTVASEEAAAMDEDNPASEETADDTSDERGPE